MHGRNSGTRVGIPSRAEAGGEGGRGRRGRQQRENEDAVHVFQLVIVRESRSLHAAGPPAPAASTTQRCRADTGRSVHHDIQHLGPVL